MQFQTKFNVGDRVWSVVDCKACELDIKSIIVDADGVEYTTYTTSDGKYMMLKEAYCFPTKESLINYICS